MQTMNMTDYPSIPKSFLEYMKKLHSKTDKKLYKKLLDVEVLKDIESKFKNGSKITNLTPKELLGKIDFKLNDLTETGFDSVIAELRVIHLLDEKGFQDIRPVKAQKVPRPDIECQRKNSTFSVEIFCSPNTSNRWNLKKYYIGKANQKKKQIDNGNGENKLLMLVLNSSPARELQSAEDYSNTLKDVLSELQTLYLWEGDYFLGIMTSGDCVFHPDI